MKDIQPSYKDTIPTNKSSPIQASKSSENINNSAINKGKASKLENQKTTFSTTNNQGENLVSNKNDGLNDIDSIENADRLRIKELKIMFSQSSKEEEKKESIQRYQKIQEKKTDLEEKLILPYNLKDIFKKQGQKYTRTVNLLSLSFWIISFALARSKNLQGIDTEYEKDSYRHWLQYNAYITIILAIVFYLFNITLTKLCVSESREEQQQPAKETEQSQPIKPSKFNYIKQKVLNNIKMVWNIIFKVYQVVMTLSVVAILMVKVYWLLKGLFFFLQLNFEQTSSFVLAFSFIQFGVFFGYGILLSVKLIIFKLPNRKEKELKLQKSKELVQNDKKVDQKNQNSVKQQIQKINEPKQKELKKKGVSQNAQQPINNSNEQVNGSKSIKPRLQQQKSQPNEQNQEKQIDSKNIQEQLHYLQKQQTVKLQTRSLIFYTNMDDFHYLVDTFVMLFIFSFGELILWKKNLPLGFEIEAQNSFRIWMSVDVLVMIAIFFVLTLSLYRMRAEGKELIMWRHQEKGLLFIELTWFNEHKFWKYLLIIMLMAKIGLAFFGFYTFMQNLDIEKSHPIMFTFMAVNFTQTIFLIIEGSAIFINGHRSSRKLNKEKEVMNQSTMVEKTESDDVNKQRNEEKNDEEERSLVKQKTN